MSGRFEMRVPDELLKRLDAARGFEARASFVKRALESALGEGSNATGSSGVTVRRGQEAAAVRTDSTSRVSAPTRTSEAFVPVEHDWRAPGRELEKKRGEAPMESLTSSAVPSKPKLPPGVKTGAQVAREQNAARMAQLNEGKYGKS